MRLSLRSLTLLVGLAACADEETAAPSPPLDGGPGVDTAPTNEGADTLARCYPIPLVDAGPARSLRAEGPPRDAVAWPPPPLPAYEGPLADNRALAAAERFGEAELARAEDIAFDAAGRLYTGSDDGRIYRAEIAADGRVSALAVFADVGRRALGLAFDACGNLVAAVPERGIVAVSPNAEVRTLADRVDGTQLAFADEVAIARDGTVYVTEASTKYDSAWPYDFLEGRPYGRVLAYEPTTGNVRVIADRDLYFPNGIVVAADESHLLVAETLRGRIQRHVLTGPRAGEVEPFAENLPLIPDNISADARGRLWVAGIRRTPALDATSGSLTTRMQLLQLPLAQLTSASPATSEPYRLVLVLDSTGALVASLHDERGSLPPISSAVPHDGFVYLATNVGRGLARVPLAP